LREGKPERSTLQYSLRRFCTSYFKGCRFNQLAESILKIDVVVLARQTIQAGGIDSLELIPGLLKCIQIRALYCGNVVMMQPSLNIIIFLENRYLCWCVVGGILIVVAISQQGKDLKILRFLRPSTALFPIVPLKGIVSRDD
jgi:hypothetical protein